METPSISNNPIVPNDNTDSGLTTLTVHCYDWKCKDEYDDNGHLVIHSWCLDRDSNPYLLRFHDFPAFCHIELPLFVNHNVANWTQYKAQQVYDHICSLLKQDAPHKFFFSAKEKLYYYRSGRRYPMMIVMFDTLKGMRKCKDILSKPITVRDMGTLPCKVWEQSIPLVRKLLTLRETKYAQWFTIEGRLVDDDDRYSTLPREYVVDRKTLNPLDPAITKSWTTKPNILAFDIETYSDRHNAMPNKYLSKHVCFAVSCIFQRMGEPSTRKKDVIVLGDCHPIPGVNIIKVKTELDLIDALSDVILKYDPEVITGYNIFKYDYPYLDVRLTRRMKEWRPLGRLLNEPSHMDNFSWGSSGYGHNEINILEMDGRISIDLYPIIRRDHKFDLYTLDFVSKQFLGRGKHDVKPKEMFIAYENMMAAHKDLVGSLGLCGGKWTKRELMFDQIDFSSIKSWFEEPERITELGDKHSGLKDTIERYGKAVDSMTRVIKYCEEDSNLCIDLFDKINCWIGLIELANVVGVTLVELFTRGQQLRVLSQVYDLASKRGYVIDERIAPKMSYAGGFVYDPIAGLYKYIPCLDFKSLYPSVMIAYNICYSTYVPPELMDKIPDEKCHVIEWDEDPNEDDDDDDDVDPEELDKGTVSTNKKKPIVHYRYKFVKEPKGILPQLLEQLIGARTAVRNLQKTEKDPVTKVVLEQRQLALKISANSVSGNTPIPCLVNEQFEYLTIEELADENTWKVDNGDNQVAQTKPNLKVWSDIGWTDVNYVIRHPIKTPLKRIVTHTACVDCTEEHSLLLPSGVQVKPAELEIGDELMHVNVELPEDTPTSYEIDFYLSDDMEERQAFVWGLFFAAGNCQNNKWSIKHKHEYDYGLITSCNALNEIEDRSFKIDDNEMYYDLMGNEPQANLEPTQHNQSFIDKYVSMFYDQRGNKRNSNVICKRRETFDKFFQWL